MSAGTVRCTAEGVTVEVRSFDGADAVVVEFDFAHYGGTISTHNAPTLVAAAAQAERDRLPLVSFVASGGVRVQDGMSSLVRLHDITRAFLRLRRAGGAHLLVARGPITGGAWALFAGAADVVLAHRGAQIGFAGSRVRPDGADPAGYTAEAKLDSGEVDAIIDPHKESSVVARYVRLLARVARDDQGSESVPVPEVAVGARLLGTGWESVQLARDPARPRADVYLEAYFDERVALSGDRCGGRDAAMITGIGLRAGRPIGYLAQAGTAISGAGFRTAARVARLADRWGVGVLTLIDTPGACNDDVAERGAVGTSIGELLATLNDLTVPITSLLIGQGTSGGALALAASGHTWAVPSSYFAVIAPEQATELLYRDPGRAEDAAEAIRLGARELRDDGIIRGIVG